MSNKLVYAPDDLLETDNVCGLDEVGRGCFAGPVVTAAVILPKDFYSPLIKDSKTLTEKQRRDAYEIIIKNALAYSVKAIQAREINDLGINPSTFKAMELCIDDLSINPSHLLIDGTQWTSNKKISYTCVPKGDNTYLAIAAASILAKVRRDDYMKEVGKFHPEYNFENNKGYFCKKHGEALLKLGMTSYHRHQYVNTWLKKQI